MKKKLVFLSAGCVLASATIAISCIVASRGGLFAKSKGTDEFYSITIDATKDITSAKDYVDGSFTVKTDQNKNDITFLYEDVSYNDGTNGDSEGVYLRANGAGYIYNAIGNEVKSMTSITIKGNNNPLTVKWGFKNESTIKFEGSTWDYATPSGHEFDFNGDKPNYFKIESGTNMNDTLITQIVIKYSTACEFGENPYRESGKIRYRLFHEDENSYYKAIGFIDKYDPANPKDLTFASEFDGVPVTAVQGFDGCSDIESVDFTGTNITEIHTFAFNNCTNLTTITGFSQITSFRYQCLQNTKISGVLSFSNQLIRIESQAFYNCDEITEVIFADGCDPTFLYYNAFDNCDSIVSCTIGNAMTNSIPDFNNCDLFADYIAAADSVYFKVDDGILYNVEPNDKLRLCAIPAHNATVNYVMADDIESTKEGFASNNAVLESFVFNDNIEVVNNDSFEYCTTLESVIIGESVSIIYNGAFNGCTSLNSIHFNGTTDQWKAISFGTGWNAGVPATEVVCSDGSVTL